MRAEEIFDYYKQFDQRFGLPHKDKWKPFAQPKVPKNKLKIGYVSPDFSQHSMQNFLMPTLTHQHENLKSLLLPNLKLKIRLEQTCRSLDTN